MGDLEGEMFEEMGCARGCVCFCAGAGIDPDSDGGSLQKGRVFGRNGETVRQRRRLRRADDRVCGGGKGACDERGGAGTQDRGDGFAGEGGGDEESRGRHGSDDDEKSPSGRAGLVGGPIGSCARLFLPGGEVAVSALLGCAVEADGDAGAEDGGGRGGCLDPVFASLAFRLWENPEQRLLQTGLTLT